MPEVASLQQVERPQLQGRMVQYSDAQHLLLIDGAVVPCTSTEFDLLMLVYRCQLLALPRAVEVAAIAWVMPASLKATILLARTTEPFVVPCAMTLP